MAAGWRTEGLDLKAKKVTFVHEDAPPAEPAPAAQQAQPATVTKSEKKPAAKRTPKRSTTKAKAAGKGRKKAEEAPADPGITSIDRYAPLASALQRAGEPQVEFTFEELEQAGVDLPNTARSKKDWWANSEKHEQARAWLEQGYRAAEVDLKKGKVSFKLV